ncbi:MAG: DNA repair protein RadA, partial [Alphaproteobacteria bacterium]|nr:DNA repair protein RadA [Alphaproteobacteria bacterium]
MARDGAIYVCQSCGAVHGKWSGQCGACGQWNSIVEESRSAPPGAMKPAASSRTRGVQFETLQSDTPEPPRIVTGVTEFDRVCGGGVVPGSAILLSGDPGVGKSTLLLDVAGRAALSGRRVAYISGEEAVEQIRARAKRMGLEKAPVELASATALREILGTLKREKFDIVIVDSIQTLWSDAHEAGPGSVTQVRACAGEMVRLAKSQGVAVVLVGHVTKDGQVAGPRVVEHMVDTVLYFEGERGHHFRLLRAVKNRFGPAHEIGVFEMTGDGLREVTNPSALFLSERDQPVPGSVVFAGIEGTRPVLVEFQALVAPSPHAQARRTVVGWDGSRLAMILAVLESRCGIPFAGLDVYLNVAGGMKVSEPAADLAVAAALISAREDQALPKDCVVLGELSLSGSLRPVGQTENRLK